MNKPHSSVNYQEFWKKISFGLELDSKQAGHFEKLKGAISDSRRQSVQEFREAFEIVMSDLDEGQEDPKRVQDMISDVFSVFTKNSQKLSAAFCKFMNSLSEKQRRAIQSRLKRFVN